MSDTNGSLAGRDVSIWPTVWKYALILAVFKVAWNVLLWTTGWAAVSGIGLVSFVISTVLLVIGLRSFRGRNAGHMTFGQGFGIAYVASIVSVVVSGAAAGFTSPQSAKSSWSPRARRRWPSCKRIRPSMPRPWR